MVVVLREGRWLLYRERGDGCCIERGEMFVEWLERKWLLYGERGDGCCMERGDGCCIWRDGR